MKQLLIRSLTGIVFVTLVIGSMFVHKWAFYAVMAFCVVMGTIEFVSMMTKKDVRLSLPMTLLLNMAAFALVLLQQSWAYILPVALLVFVYELIRHKASAVDNMAYAVFSMLWFAIPLAIVCLMLNISRPLVILFFAAIWLYDSGAYCVGSLIGKHRLYASVSPKKSLEGAIGGFVITLVLSYFIPQLSGVNINLTSWQWVLLMALCMIASTFGDLTESLIKRTVNVKDSGNIMPGHGGILDRFDSVFFAAPVVYVVLLLLIIC